MDKSMKIRVRKTPNGLHLYTATARGLGTYGWGNTPAEARERLMANIEHETQEAAKVCPVFRHITGGRG